MKLEKSHRQHETSESHRETILKWEFLKRPPMNEQLSFQIKQFKGRSFESPILPLRQGLAIRGHSEVEHQLLIMVSTYDDDIKK